MLGVAVGAVVTSQAMGADPAPAPHRAARMLRVVVVGRPPDPVVMRPRGVTVAAMHARVRHVRVERAERLRRARRARRRALAAQRAAQAQQAAATPSASTGFEAAMDCIGIHEEGGSNSVAGYFGFVYPPSAYIEPGPSIAATYGDSWLDVPRSAQLELAAALQAAYGWSPWSTAGACGLA